MSLSEAVRGCGSAGAALSNADICLSEAVWRSSAVLAAALLALGMSTQCGPCRDRAWSPAPCVCAASSRGPLCRTCLESRYASNTFCMYHCLTVRMQQRRRPKSHRSQQRTQRPQRPWRRPTQSCPAQHQQHRRHRRMTASQRLENPMRGAMRGERCFRGRTTGIISVENVQQMFFHMNTPLCLNTPPRVCSMT